MSSSFGPGQFNWAKKCWRFDKKAEIIIFILPRLHCYIRDVLKTNAGLAYKGFFSFVFIMINVALEFLMVTILYRIGGIFPWLSWRLERLD